MKATQMPSTDFWQTTKVPDSFKIIAGGNFPRETKEDGLPILRGRDLARSILLRDDVERFDTPKTTHPDKFAKLRDILVQRIGERPRSRLVDPELAGCYVGDTLLILRPKDNDVNSLAIAQYLESDAGKESLSGLARGVVVPSLTTRSFESLVVPCLPRSFSDELEAARLAEMNIAHFLSKLAQKRSSLFGAISLEEAEQRVTDLSTTRLVVETALKFEDDLNYRLGNFYPYPIAFAFRQADTIHEPVRGVLELYRVAEAIVSFLTSITLALIEAPSDSFRKKLVRAWSGNGATFGTWMQLLQEAASEIVNRTDSLARAITMVAKPSTQLSNDLKELVRMRNEAIHENMPSEGPEIEAHLIDIKERLRRLFIELEFLIRHPLRLVVHLDGIRDSNEAEVTSYDYSGDHPSCRKIAERCKSLPKTSDLYILIDGSTWVPLYPFISVRYKKGIRATRFTDRFDQKSSEARLKSYESGEIQAQKEIGLEIARWLNLKASQ